MHDAGLVSPGNYSGSIRNGCGDPRFLTVFLLWDAVCYHVQGNRVSRPMVFRHMGHQIVNSVHRYAIYGCDDITVNGIDHAVDGGGALGFHEASPVGRVGRDYPHQKHSPSMGW